MLRWTVHIRLEVETSANRDRTLGVAELELRIVGYRREPRAGMHGRARVCCYVSISIIVVVRKSIATSVTVSSVRRAITAVLG